MPKVHHEACPSKLYPSHLLSFVNYFQFACLMSLLDHLSEDGKLVGYFKCTQKNPQAHGYRCSFHPGVFQSIDFHEEHEVH